MVCGFCVSNCNEASVWPILLVVSTRSVRDSVYLELAIVSVGAGEGYINCVWFFGIGCGSLSWYEVKDVCCSIWSGLEDKLLS